MISCSLVPARAAHCIDKSKKLLCACAAISMFVKCCGGNKFVIVHCCYRMCLIVCYSRKAVVVDDIVSAELIVDS